MSLKFKPVTHCIFDMDGLLLDTEVMYTIMAQSIIDRFSHKVQLYTWEIQSQMLGIPLEEEGRKIAEIFKLPFSGEEYKKMAEDLIPILMRNCQKCAGAERLIKHLVKHKIPICVATTSPEKTYKIKTESHKEFFALFNHVVNGSSDDEVKNGKPAPDIFLVAARRFNDKPKYENCLVFEDAPNGVKAAKSAGMQVVMVPDSRTSDDQKSEATQVVDSLLNFKPEDFGLPAFDDFN